MATNESYFSVFSVDFQCLFNMVEEISKTTQIKKKKKTIWNFNKSPEISTVDICS